MNKLKLELKSEISDDLKQGLKKIEIILNPKSGKYNELIHIKGRHAQILEDFNKGIISLSKRDLVLNNIRISLIELIDNLKEEEISYSFENKNNFELDNSIKKLIIFDIDNTILKEGEKLDISSKHGGQFVELFKEFLKKGFSIFFLTGEGYNKQKPRVLEPLVNLKIADDILMFSDGGTRLFYYDKLSNGFAEDDNYSSRFVYKETEIEKIRNEFNRSLDVFQKKIPNLGVPDVIIYGKGKVEKTMTKYLDLMIRPIKTSFWESPELEEFKSDIEEIVLNSDITSHLSITSNSYLTVNIRIKGEKCEEDSHQLRNHLFDLFMTEHKNIALPEFIVRGNKECKSQIVFKPFKRNNYRFEFLEDFSKQISKNNIGNNLSFLIAGRTAIDILPNNGSKAKAVEYMIDELKYRPANIFYFGDEFMEHGNDITIARLNVEKRPSKIYNVGDENIVPNDVKEIIIMDGHGPEGTINHLKSISRGISLMNKQQ